MLHKSYGILGSHALRLMCEQTLSLLTLQTRQSFESLLDGSNVASSQAYCLALPVRHGASLAIHHAVAASLFMDCLNCHPVVCLAFCLAT